MGIRDWFRRTPDVRVAATTPIDPTWARTSRSVKQHWWERATHFSENLGVIRFAAGLKANSGSRCDLIVEKLTDPRSDEWEPVTRELAPQDLLRQYRGETQDQRELVRLHLWHYEVLGEALQTHVAVNGRLSFGIHSPRAVEWKNDRVIIRDVPGGTVRDGTARELTYAQVARLWIPDETWNGRSVSSLKAVLPDCERYWSLQRRMARTADSALGMSKVVWTPDEAHTHLARAAQDPTGHGPGTELERDYYAAAQRMFSDDDAVESITPMMWRWKHSYGKPEVVDLSQPFDAQAIPWRNEALEAIGRGLDYPQRLLVAGVGDGNHWADWLLEEQFAKNALAPALERVCWGDLTRSFLRPGLEVLRRRGVWDGDPDRYRVGFDMSPVVVHPNQSQLAIELYNLGVISDRALLDVTGFDVAQAPDTAELERWVQRMAVIARRRDGQPVDGSSPRVLPGQPVAGSLDARSRVRETVPLGPFPGELTGWLD